MTMFGSRCDALFRISPEAIHFCIPMYTRSIQKIDCFVALDANESSDNIQRQKRKQQQRRRRQQKRQQQQQRQQQKHHNGDVEFPSRDSLSLNN